MAPPPGICARVPAAAVDGVRGDSTVVGVPAGATASPGTRLRAVVLAVHGGGGRVGRRRVVFAVVGRLLPASAHGLQWRSSTARQSVAGVDRPERAAPATSPLGPIIPAGATVGRGDVASSEDAVVDLALERVRVIRANL